ncbi:MAG: DNA-3-methyladenine glycosylase I [Microbacteriaceae bacterium]|nr:DNA-3-methyladenine glycosylase I [Microbacteriaceae bacterium]
MSTLLGADGMARCAWVGADAEYARYHDEEWGVPLHGDRALFEKIALEGFQAGLSWITILRRRPGFREAFHGFDPAVIAEWGPDDVERLMRDVRIIRNRAKIEATIGNARALLALQAAEGDGALDRLVWSFAPAREPIGSLSERSESPGSLSERSESKGAVAASRARPRDFSGIPAETPESKALSKALKARGFRFVGATTMYALMQSAGLVDDHVEGCWRAA